MRKAQWKIDGLYRIGLSTLTCKGNKRHRQKWKVRSIAGRKRHAFKSMCFRRVRKREWRKTKTKRERERERWRKENYLSRGTVSVPSNIYDVRKTLVVYKLLL